ncbi:DNA ligase [Vibrio sp. 10N.286.49.B3]|uniref:DNA ligase n=1 Tax=Vibrio sp. 10N.286.49.B3 TaxID=1880855 RepID=UPI000C843FC8|nr:DNA ligase [Vibrio sp. 10N.286.49.B3]PMH44938.1 DNA ligase [Vibrio sp. 10N.286.49.B3]
MSIRFNMISFALIFAFPSASQGEVSEAEQVFSEPFSLLSALSYTDDVDLSQYWYSEKLDGIRARWDGQHLYTRSGKKIVAPDWFIAGFPTQVLEGELWAGRGGFHLVQSTVLDHKPSDLAWKNITFMVFDNLTDKQAYQFRYQELQALLQKIDLPQLQLVEHHAIKDKQQLESLLQEVDSGKGEGLMLRRFDSFYRAGRSSDLLKLKKNQDAEAVVVGYKLGKGRLLGQVGSLLVKFDDRIEFAIGSGLSDKLRQNPPPIGTTITFRYNGFTNNGVPKFARYIRERPSND